MRTFTVAYEMTACEDCGKPTAVDSHAETQLCEDCYHDRIDRRDDAMLARRSYQW